MKILKKINHYTIGFFERKLLEPLIKLLIIGFIIFILFFISGCNPYQNQINKNQAKINTILIDNMNIDKLNECTKLKSCEGWKCLCDNMLSENDYCKRYKDFCVNNVCEEITINFNGVNFMEEHFGDKYNGCIFIYDKVVIISGINLEDINEENFTCLSDYRNSQEMLDEDITEYFYENKFYNEYGEIIC